MRGGDRRTHEARARISSTTLADGFLVLLVISMVILPILRSGSDGKLPPKRPGMGPENSIVLEISSDGPLRINRQPVAERDLGVKLRGLLSARPGQPVFVATDDSVRYGEVMRVLDTCGVPGAGSELAFILE